MCRGSFRAEALLDDGYQGVNRDGDPYLGAYGIAAGAIKCLYPQALFYPFEEQFNLPAAFVGGSNGGLLVGVAFTQRPELYQAVVCMVPILDMQRYNKLLAGASWMGEYGDPDIPEEWAYLKKYSPYHNLKDGVKYPDVLFTASTTDDRVHPGHARKMAAKMEAMGYEVYFHENTEGGHTGATTNARLAKTTALDYTFLLMKLK